jgi:hypothetical protein
MTFELIDLQELGEKALEDFTQSLESATAKGGELGSAAERLVAQVEFTYALAAKLAHREPTVEGTMAIWAKMVSLCDQIAAEAQRTSGDPAANKAAFDRILDLRNAAERRRELHS